MVAIPWKTNTRPTMQYAATRARDRKICARLTNEEKSLYRDAVQILLRGNYATSLSQEDEAIHFISVRPVFDTQRATTRCRLCLDARSINQHTRAGPTSNNTILRTLLLFRKEKHITTFDLTKAFWQIKYLKDERKWFSTVILDQIIRFDSLIFGSNFSPAALESTLAIIHRKGNEFLQKGSALERLEPSRPAKFPDISFYVDDYHCRTPADSHPSEHAIGVTWLRWWLEQHGFPSTKVYTAGIGSEWSNYLGYQWHTQSDQLRLKTPPLTLPTGGTLRDVISTLSGLYDPLGLNLKWQLLGRLIAHDAHNSTKEHDKWNQDVNSTIIPTLAQWCQRFQPQQCQRRVHYEHLYIFSDSSSTCWAYEVRDEDLNFIVARGGIVPQNMTIPHAELLGIHRGLKDLQDWPLEELGTRRITLYTDSLCNIQRLKRIIQKDLGIAEERKIKQIYNFANSKKIVYNIRHIWGIENPADYYTRPIISDNQPQSIDTLRLYSAPRVLHTNHPQLQTPRPIITNPDITQNIEINESLSEIIEGDDSSEVLKNNPTDIHNMTTHGQIAHAHGEDHKGINATTLQLKHLNITNIRKEVKNYIRNCDTCQRARENRTIRTAMGNHCWIENLEDVGPSAIVGIDIFTVQPQDDENDRYTCCLVVTCATTKWLRAKALKTQLAYEVVVALTQIFNESIYPKIIVTDSGPCFRSRKFLTFTGTNNIHTAFIPAHSSTYGGWFERSNLSLQTSLRILIAQRPQHMWEEHLHRALHVCNSRPYDIRDRSGLCPLDIVFNSCWRDDQVETSIEEILKSTNLSHVVFCM